MAHQTLRERLNPSGVEALDALSQKDREQVETLFASAQQRHRDELQDAVDQAMEYVPRLLRKRILKMLGG